MFLISHALGSFFVLFLLKAINPSLIPDGGITLLLSALFSMLPDADLLWSKDSSNHHRTLTHTPAFWLSISILAFLLYKILYLAPLWVVLLILVQSTAHLAFDYVAARHCGIMLFYPFSRKEYSMVPLTKPYKKTRADSRLKRSRVRAYTARVRNYVDYTALTVFEICMALAGLISLAFY